jgi:hypothetical protein
MARTVAQPFIARRGLSWTCSASMIICSRCFANMQPVRLSLSPNLQLFRRCRLLGYFTLCYLRPSDSRPHRGCLPGQNSSSPRRASTTLLCGRGPQRFARIAQPSDGSQGLARRRRWILTAPSRGRTHTRERTLTCAHSDPHETRARSRARTHTDSRSLNT